MSDRDSPSFSFSGLQRQSELYRLGLKGQVPDPPVRLEELEQRAKAVLPPAAYDYVAGGAGSEDTIRANLAAFRRWRIVPRFLRDVGRRSLAVDVLGHRFPAPFLLAPIGVQSIVHPDGELAVARASRSLGIPMILSTLGSRSIEEVAAALGDTPRWFQLYWPRSDALAASFLHRAEKAGYGAIVVTLDTFFLAWRERDLDHAYLPFAEGHGLASYFSDPVFCAMLDAPPRENPAAAISRFSELYSNPSLTWKSLAFLRAQTRLPILLKGILAPEDALLAVESGVDGIIVSNHGGRQVDGAIAALDALPGVVDAVAGRAAVLFDSGIRRGADVIKALCLGAQAVLLGRPYCYGLALGGESGVRDVALNLMADIDLTLGLMGCTSPAELGRTNLREHV
jgi:isopentenyl diphosphate isomerase/L-lactate dehydrogenase-like FMN-dependent dehydrogenase